MKLAKKIFGWALVAVWALVSNHCPLEAISGLEFLACSPESATSPHQPSDCGDEKDACATVEAGLYKTEESQISAGKVSFAAVKFILALLSDAGAPTRTSSQALPEESPPELAHTWQFTSRTALPPRAPSFIS